MEDPAPIVDGPIDYDGTLLIGDMARVLQTSHDTIRRRLRAGTFPIPPLRGIDRRLRWSGPVVRRWLDRNGPLAVAGGGRARRKGRK